MPVDDMIVGLDIGTTKVCAVIGEFDENNRLQITGVGTSPSEGLRRGVVINIESTMRSVTSAIEAAEMMSGREVLHLVTGIAGAHIEGINSRGVVAVTGKGREINREDIGRVIDAAKAIVIPMDREVIHVIPQEFVVDDQGGIKDPLDMIGIRLEAEVHIVTGSVTSAQNLLKCVNRAGFRVKDIVLQPLAAAGAVLTEEEKEMGVLLIDLGGGTTDILVYIDGAPYHTNVLALGGGQVTSDLSFMLKIPNEAAERIKRESGVCYLPLVDKDEDVVIRGIGGWPSVTVQRREVCKIIQPRMAEIYNLVKEQLMKKDYLRHLGGGVVLTGGGAMIPGAAELAQEIFGRRARVGVPTKLGGLSDVYQTPIYSTAVGLVLYEAAQIQSEGGASVSPRRSGSGMMAKLKNWMKEFF
ncbi:cell division protein FtsA [Sediminispirochaeta smaragdinae]|uniref:Cell division protein FtsA n=1 Tax=Sediminispirochaeta smaragdinae (strain DSM 11293 / JCM 15392 / SEBR 4228) TaxID=573413 RepID=E1R5R3_SEDSS|nr:cell division protein FtsA [Sediminispirochaeta smaragdinae]ADK80678.1 cell division protein FtsA [Sediminispirochaeta smaragdinae DSM 11293]